MISKRAFITAGNATFTVTSKKTGVSFTYRVRESDKSTDTAPGPYFVSVLTGPANETDYTFIGTIFADGGFRHSKKSTIGFEAPSVVGFCWLWRNADQDFDDIIDAQAEFRHAGHCCRCGRLLTTPESCDKGIGPECEKKL